MKRFVLVAMLFLASCAKQPAPASGVDTSQASASVTGARIVFEIDVDSVRRDRLDKLEFDIRKAMRQHRISYTIGPSTTNGILICVLDDARIADAESAIQLLIGPPGEEIGTGVPIYRIIRNAPKCFVVEETAEFHEEFLDDVMQQEIEVMERRATYASQISIRAQRLSSNRFQLDIPGILDMDRVRDAFATTAELTVRLVNDNVTDDDIRRKQVPENTEILERQPQDGKTLPPLAVYRDTILSGIWIDRASNATAEQTEKPAVNVSLDERYVEAFADVTKKNIGRRLAIVLDGKVLEAPLIVAPITGGVLQITGDFTQEQALALASQLDAGAVPTILRIVDAQITDLSKH
jgi:protein-export membrane protein SecD